MLGDDCEHRHERQINGQASVEFPQKLFPRRQSSKAGERRDHHIFQVLHAHLPQERRVFVQPMRRQEIKFHKNKKEDDANLNEVENGFHIDPRGILALVQNKAMAMSTSSKPNRNRTPEVRGGSLCSTTSWYIQPRFAMPHIEMPIPVSSQ